jgi:tripartite-type tricarboxylate transporter receptor subunit TctC
MAFIAPPVTDREKSTTVYSARRSFIARLLAAAALPARSRVALAQDYPSRPVRIVIGFAAGGAGDILARLAAQALTERLGQPFFVENRPGAGSNLGTEMVVHAAPDGYTLLLTTNPNAVNGALYGNLPFDFLRDIAPVAGILRGPLVLIVHPSVPAHSLAELVDYLRANPGKLSFASVGNGSAPHLAAALFEMLAGVQMLHVPYRGGANALTDLLAGQVQVMFSINPTLDYVAAGKLRALAVTTATRSALLPQLPSVGEVVPGYEASVWFGIGAPAGTPTGVIATLNAAVIAALADPKIKARLADFGGEALALQPSDFGRLVADDTAKWAKVIRAAGITAE